MDKIGQVPDRYLSEEQRLMRQTCRRYVDAVVRPFIAANREREWLFDPDQRLPAEILAEADRAGLRGLGVPDRYGGVGLDPATEAQTFSIIATELAAVRRGRHAQRYEQFIEVEPDGGREHVRLAGGRGLRELRCRQAVHRRPADLDAVWALEHVADHRGWR